MQFTAVGNRVGSISAKGALALKKRGDFRWRTTIYTNTRELHPSTTVDRVTKQSAFSCQKYLEERLRSEKHGAQQVTTCNGSDEPMLIELDGCEIRTGTFAAPESGLQNGQTDRTKIVAWRDVRVGLARPMSADSKLYVAQMEKYPEVVSQLFSVATILGMTEQTPVIAVADGGHGLQGKGSGLAMMHQPNRVAEGFSPSAPTPPRMRVRTGRFTEFTGP